MSEHEQEQTNEEQDPAARGDQSPEEFAEELEDDPAYAGGDDAPADELRGG